MNAPIVSSSRPLVLYHKDCSDGFSAAWCFWRKYGVNADYLASDFQTDPPDVVGRDVYLVDFSYPRSVVRVMLDFAASITLIDHHKSALEDLLDLPGLKTFTDQGRSGATLAWDFLFPDEARPPLLGYIEDRDLYRFRLAGCREVISYVFSHYYTFEMWDKLMAADQVELMKMTAAGAALERKRQKDVQELSRNCARRMIIAGHEVQVAGVPHELASEVGELLCTGAPFAATYWDAEDSRRFSLRSSADGGLDVSAVARLFGGGGHARASGFRVPRSHELARC